MARKPWPERPDRCQFCAAVRHGIIRQSLDSHVGHIGSALSVVEMISVLWNDILRSPGTNDPDRDRFILAKGHAALALYMTMHFRGLLDEDKLRTFCRDGSQLGVHPEFGLAGVEISTGSLGQGLSVACGITLALRRRNSPARVFVLMSDAECNEGQVWEAAMFAAHHRLDNLIALVDVNGMQAMGPTKEVLDLAPLARRFEAFGWHEQEVDGHDEAALRHALTTGIANREGPAIILAHTVAAKGVHFMERQVEWHYRNIDETLAEQALQEIGVGV
ncbi:MAG TPA: transketolase [Gemmataceae bacterium]|nr:transketolase [Gemmataceae bacterium]